MNSFVQYNSADNSGYYKTYYQQGLVRELVSWKMGLQNSLIPLIAWGDPAATFARTTLATGQDFEGLNKRLLSGEPRFLGSRREQNLIPSTSSSEDMTDAAYSDVNNAVSAAKSTVFDGTANGEVGIDLTITDDGSGAGGRTFAFRALISTSGTPSSDAALQIGIKGNAITAVNQDIGSAVTSTDQPFYVIASTDAAGTVVRPVVICDDAITVNISEWMPIELTGSTNFNPPEYISSGLLSAPFHGSNIDSVKGFNTHKGNTYSTSTRLITEALGALINSSNSQYAEIDGVDGSNISTLDSAAASITGDFDFRTRVTLVDLSPSNSDYLISKTQGAGQRSFDLGFLSSGILRFRWSEDGTALIIKDSTVNPDTVINPGEIAWFRVTLDVDNGATGNDVKFWYSKEAFLDSADVTWIQLGATVTTAATTSIFDSTAVVRIGSSEGFNVLNGKVQRAQLFNGIDGTLAVDYNANDYDTGLTQTSSTTSEVWTYNGGASVFSPYSRWIDFPGSASDNVTTGDTPAASIIGDLTLIAWIAPNDWTPPVTSDTIIWKGAEYIWQLLTDGKLELSWTSAQPGPSSVVTGFVDGTGHWLRVTRGISGADYIIDYFTSNSPYRTPVHKIVWSNLGTQQTIATAGNAPTDSASNVEIGSRSGGGADLLKGKIARAVIIASTDPTVAPVVDYDPRAHISGSTFTAVTSEVWTLNGNTAIEGGRNGVAQWDVDGPYGYLLEQARTNVAQHTDALDNVVWTKANVTIDVAASRGPDGRLTADRVNVTADANIHSVADTTITNTSGRNVAFSASVKFDGEQYVFLNLQTSVEDHISANFDIQSGLVDTTDTGTTSGTIVRTSIEAEGNGYYRLELVGSIAEVAALNWTFGSGGSAGPTWDSSGRVSFTPSAGDDFFATAIQVEDDAAFASSYIPNTTGTEVRNKDDLTYTSAANTSYPMTVSLGFVPSRADPTADLYLIQIDDGSVNNRVTLLIKPSRAISGFVASGTVTQAAIVANDTLVIGVATTATLVSAVDNIALFQDGKATGTADTSSIAPVGLTRINIGQSFNAGKQPFGPIRNITITAKALDDFQILNP